MKRAMEKLTLAPFACLLVLALAFGACDGDVSSEEHDRVSAQLAEAERRISSQEQSIQTLSLDLQDALALSEGVSDFGELLVEGPTIIELTPYSAVVMAITGVDVVCGIAFGSTTDYGRTATDLDMAGAGHRNHRPLLTGLQPDTLYHYVLGGIDSDGNVYRTRDFTFRTPRDDSRAGRPTGDNLALTAKGARVVRVSSTFGGGGLDDLWGAIAPSTATRGPSGPPPEMVTPGGSRSSFPRGPTSRPSASGRGPWAPQPRYFPSAS